jgi:hypothetical protein
LLDDHNRVAAVPLSKLAQTPIFQKIVEDERVARAPVVEVLKRQPKEIALVALARMGQMVVAFVYAAFLFTYGMQVVHLSRDFLLEVMLIASFFSFFTIPLSGYLLDRIGRKQVYIFGAVATGLLAFGYYALLDTAIPGLILLATLVAYFFHDLMWGPLAAMAAECFTPRLRYSGASIGFSWPRCSPAARRAGRNGNPRGDRFRPGDRALHLCLCCCQRRRDRLAAERPGSRFHARPPLI